MNALADKVHKQGMPHSDMLHNMAPLFNNHLYISSSKLSTIWHATATYVGNNVAVTCYGAYHCVAFRVCVLCQPVHSLSHPYTS